MDVHESSPIGQRDVHHVYVWEPKTIISKKSRPSARNETERRENKFDKNSKEEEEEEKKKAGSMCHLWPAFEKEKGKEKNTLNKGRNLPPSSTFNRQRSYIAPTLSDSKGSREKKNPFIASSFHFGSLPLARRPSGCHRMRRCIFTRKCIVLHPSLARRRSATTSEKSQTITREKTQNPSMASCNFSTSVSGWKIHETFIY